MRFYHGKCCCHIISHSHWSWVVICLWATACSWWNSTTISTLKMTWVQDFRLMDKPLSWWLSPIWKSWQSNGIDYWKLNWSFYILQDDLLILKKPMSVILYRLQDCKWGNQPDLVNIPDTFEIWDKYHLQNQAFMAALVVVWSRLDWTKSSKMSSLTSFQNTGRWW